MTPSLDLSFADANVCAALVDATDTELDALDFGVIGFDAAGVVRRYNAFESRCAGLSTPLIHAA